MLQQILSGLTPTALILSAVQAVIITFGGRLLLKAIGKRPPKEGVFWVSSLVGIFLIVAVASAVLGTDKRPKLKGQILAVNAGELKYIPW